MIPSPPLPLSLLAGLLLVTAAVGYGRALFGLVVRSAPRRPLEWIVSAALGLGLTAYAVLGLGLLGLLLRPVLAGVVAGGILLLAVAVLPRLRARRPSLPRTPPLPAAALWAACAGLALLTLLESQRPVDGLDWDSLSYHLAAPKLYLVAGRITFIEYDSHTHFPFTLEMLYTLALALGGDGPARMLHWACGWLAALAAAAWTAERNESGAPWAPPLAALVFASAPVVLWEMGTAYIDLGAALFQSLSVYLVADMVAPSAGGSRRGAPALAGILCGFALGTKMTALVHVVILGLLLLPWVLRSGRGDRRAAFQAAAAVLLLAAVTGAPWYLKSWLWTGNPVYPFLYSLFPGSYSWTPEAAAAYATEQASFGVGKRPQDLFMAPWNLTVHARHFYINYRSLNGDRLGTLGPAVVCLLPALPWAGRPDRAGRLLLAYAGLSLITWFGLSHQVRYLIPALPILAVALALGCTRLDRPVRRAALAVAGAGCALGLQTHLPVALGVLQPVLNPGLRQDYLRASLGGLFEAAEYANSLPGGSRIAFYQETRGYYFDRPYFWANPLQHNLIPYERLPSGTALLSELRRFGITHVLINYSFCEGVQDSRWYRLLMDALEHGKLAPRFASPGAQPGRRGVVVYEVAS